MSGRTTPVIPAKAGIQSAAVPGRESVWIPWWGQDQVRTSPGCSQPCPGDTAAWTWPHHFAGMTISKELP